MQRISHCLPWPSWRSSARSIFPSVQGIVRHATTSISYQQAHRTRQEFAGGPQTVGDGNRTRCRLQRNKLIHVRIPQEHWRNADLLPPEPHVRNARPAQGLSVRLSTAWIHRTSTPFTSADARGSKLDNSSARIRLASRSKPSPRAPTSRAKQRTDRTFGRASTTPSGWRTGGCLSAQARLLRLRASARRVNLGGGRCG